MSKPANVDVNNLFQKFGGDSSDYREIRREQTEEKSHLSWPIVAAMKSEFSHAPKLKLRQQPLSSEAPAQQAPVAPQYFATGGAKRAEVQKNRDTEIPSFLARRQEEAAPPQGGLQALFGSLEVPASPAQAGPKPEATEPAHVSGGPNDSLSQVFSRLLNTSQPDAVPQNNLRSVLGRLIK